MMGFYLLGDMGSGEDDQHIVAKSLTSHIKNNKKKGEEVTKKRKANGNTRWQVDKA